MTHFPLPHFYSYINHFPNLADSYPEDAGSMPLRNVGTHHQTTW